MTAPFIRRGAQVTPRDLSEAGVDGANLTHHLLPGVIGTLHDLACDNHPCWCAKVYRVVETEQTCDNGDDGDAWDQDASVAIAYTRTAPALPADPRFGRGVVVRGSGE